MTVLNVHNAKHDKGWCDGCQLPWSGCHTFYIKYSMPHCTPCIGVLTWQLTFLNSLKSFGHSWEHSFVIFLSVSLIMYLYSCQEHTVLIPKLCTKFWNQAVWLQFYSSFSIVLGILGLLRLHMNFRMDFSISAKPVPGFFFCCCCCITGGWNWGLHTSYIPSYCYHHPLLCLGSH